MKCLLIQSSYIDQYRGVEELSAPMLPVGLASIAAVLRREGIDVSITDLNVEPALDPKAIARIVAKEGIDLVGIGAMTSSIAGAASLARKIKAETGAPIVIGGPHASAVREETMEQIADFDYLVFGEGEYTMVELCKTLRSGSKELSGIAGLGYRVEGRPVFNRPRPLIPSLDDLPFPARDLCRFDRYDVPAYLRSGSRSAHLITSRGCPFKCTFCSAHTVTGRRFRPHSPARVVAEIESLMHSYGARFFLMYDDTFTISRERVAAICELILERDLRFKWFCMARADTVDQELIDLMHRSGLAAINFGVESGDEEVLRRIKKGITPDQVRKAFRMVRRHRGLRVFSSFMIGLPGETTRTIRKTIDFAVELDPDMAFFFIFTPYPGTDIYDECRGVDFDVSDSWGRFSHVLSDSPLPLKSKEFSEQQLKEMLVWANRRFYARPSFIMRNLIRTKSLKELRAKLKGLWQFVKQNLRTAGVLRRRGGA